MRGTEPAEPACTSWGSYPRTCRLQAGAAQDVWRSKVGGPRHPHEGAAPAGDGAEQALGGPAVQHRQVLRGEAARRPAPASTARQRHRPAAPRASPAGAYPAERQCHVHSVDAVRPAHVEYAFGRRLGQVAAAVHRGAAGGHEVSHVSGRAPLVIKEGRWLLHAVCGHGSRVQEWWAGSGAQVTGGLQSWCRLPVFSCRAAHAAAGQREARHPSACQGMPRADKCLPHAVPGAPWQPGWRQCSAGTGRGAWGWAAAGQR